jgi:hypothetical protein
MARGLGSASCFFAVGRRKKKGEKNPGADHALVLTLEAAVKLLAKYEPDEQAEIYEVDLTTLQELLLARNTAEEVLASAEGRKVVGLRHLSRDGKTELELSLRQRFDIFEEGSDPVATWTEFKTGRDKIAFCLEPAFYGALSAGQGVFVSTNLRARARATGEKYERESLFGMTGMSNKQAGVLYELAWYIAGLYGNEGAPQLEPCAHSEAEVGAAAERLAELIDGSPEGLASKAQVLARAKLVLAGKGVVRAVLYEAKDKARPTATAAFSKAAGGGKGVTFRQTPAQAAVSKVLFYDGENYDGSSGAEILVLDGTPPPPGWTPVLRTDLTPVAVMVDLWRLAASLEGGFHGAIFSEVDRVWITTAVGSAARNARDNGELALGHWQMDGWQIYALCVAIAVQLLLFGRAYAKPQAHRTGLNFGLWGEIYSESEASAAAG